MKVKKMLLSLFFLVVCLCSSVFALDYSLNQGVSVSTVRIADCFNLSAGKDLTFRAGTDFSIKNSVFAFCSLHDYEQRLSQKAFKSPGDVVSFTIGSGYAHRFETDYLIFSTGLDFIFPSSGFSKIYAAVFAEAGYEWYVFSENGFKTFISAFLNFSFSKPITVAAFGVGCTLKKEEVR